MFYLLYMEEFGFIKKKNDNFEVKVIGIKIELLIKRLKFCIICSGICICIILCFEF